MEGRFMMVVIIVAIVLAGEFNTAQCVGRDRKGELDCVIGEGGVLARREVKPAGVDHPQLLRHLKSTRNNRKEAADVIGRKWGGGSTDLTAIDLGESKLGAFGGR